MRKIRVADTETSGLSPEEGAGLLEIAWVDLQETEEGWYVVDGMSRYIEHPGPIPASARAVHHISPEDCLPGSVNCVSTGQGRAEIQGGEPAAYAFHNAAFDTQFLPGLPAPVICTWRCALHLWPEQESHSNQYLRYSLGLEPQKEFLVDPVSGRELTPHRALYDAACTAEILRRMLETHTLDDLHRLSYQPVVLLKVRFGKHRGLLWSQVDRGYLQWVVKQADMDDDVRHTAMHHLRGGQGSLL